MQVAWITSVVVVLLLLAFATSHFNICSIYNNDSVALVHAVLGPVNSVLASDQRGDGGCHPAEGDLGSVEQVPPLAVVIARNVAGPGLRVEMRSHAESVAEDVIRNLHGAETNVRIELMTKLLILRRLEGLLLSVKLRNTIERVVFLILLKGGKLEFRALAGLIVLADTLGLDRQEGWRRPEDSHGAKSHLQKLHMSPYLIL